MKQIYKGSPDKIMDELETYFKGLSQKDMNKIYQVSLDNTRTLSQNNLVHTIIRDIALFTGEDFNRMKRIIKTELGYFNDTHVDTDDSSYITRIYSKTSEMSSKELGEFILKLETWAMHTLDFNCKNYKIL